MIPGFGIWLFEYVRETTDWTEVHMHVPDSVTTTEGRHAWAKSTGAVPVEAFIHYVTKSACQDHTFQCRASDHIVLPPEITPDMAADEALAALREHLRSREPAVLNDRERDYGTDLRGNSPPQWEMDLMWPPPASARRMPNVGACGIEGCGCTDDDFDPDPFDHNI